MSSARWLSVICLVASLAGGQVTHAAQALPVIPGSTAFCLFEVPSDDEDKRRWINLGIVQYLEASNTEVKIFYGGGAFGGGYEARFKVKDSSEIPAILEKMRLVASACR